MKNFLVVLFLFCSTQSFARNMSIFSLLPAPVAAGCSDTADLLNEDFEGTGYENAWTATGGTYPDYTTTILRGAQSFAITSNNEYNNAYIGFSQQTTVYGFLMFRITADFDIYFLNILNSDGSAGVMDLHYIPTGYLRLWSGNSNATYSGVSLNTTYYMWYDCTRGSGANGVAHFYISTTKTKPASPDLTITNGDSTAYPARIRLFTSGNTGGTGIWDHIRLNTTSIGDVCD